MPRIILFGDSEGVSQLLRHVPAGNTVAIVAPSNRPYEHSKLQEKAAILSIPLLIQPLKQNREYDEFLYQLSMLEPDFFFVFSYAMKVHQQILDIPMKIAMNIHGSLLPRYRGCNPIQWAMIHNEQVTGVTLHHMTEQYDEGDIIAQREIPIYFEDTWIDVQIRMGSTLDNLLEKVIPTILDGNSDRRPQDNTQASLFHRRNPDDGLIDWNWSTLKIYNLIRALVKPHPGAFYYDQNGKKVILDRFISFEEVKIMRERIKREVCE